ncbi:MAG: TonB-dependent receptor plug domain-containing protein, partial [Wenzhouxiangella sp.]
MMRRLNLRRTALATSIAFALHAGTAMAQDPELEQDQEQQAQSDQQEQRQDTDESQTPDVIVVTGYRSSILRAMDRKRGATGFIDSVTAEDMGSFPDQNLAEALQRIPGVSIN